jgi:hypothetical protein
MSIALILMSPSELFGQSKEPPVAVVDGTQTVVLQGKGGGTQQHSSCAGFITTTPNHQLQVTTASNLQFSLQGSEDSSLLILGEKGQAFCVQADKTSQGKVEIPGRWQEGTYNVFVGSSKQQDPEGGSSYTLTISPLQY